MDNSPKFGQLPRILQKSLKKFSQKQNANSASCYQLVVKRQIKKLDQLVKTSSTLAEKIRTLKNLILKIKDSWRVTYKHYGTALVIDFLVLLLVITLGIQPAAQLISPWVDKFQPAVQIDQNLKNHKHFAFIPGWSSSKFARVKLEGLSTLAFFDLPVNGDGTLNLDNTGYQNLKGDQANELFLKAHQQGIKVLVILSQVDRGEINKILSDYAAWQNVISQTIDEVKNSSLDGIAIDFEYGDNVSGQLIDKYSAFVRLFSQKMHQQLPGSKVAVAIPNSLAGRSIYDLPALAQVSDQILIIADNIAVPETRDASLISPVFASDNNTYFSALSLVMGSSAQQLPPGKVEMETAWYGNGDNYPLYIPHDQPETKTGNVTNTLRTPLSNELIDSLVYQVPDKAQGAVRKNLPYIAKALEDEGILNENVLSYALATVEHETAGTFEPIEEIKGRKSARRLGYEGGTDYFGRGFIQLTHLRNYKKIGERIGLGNQLVQNPDLASKTEVASKILAAFFKDNNVASLASSGNFVAARDPINPDYWAYFIARLAMKYLSSMG